MRILYVVVIMHILSAVILMHIVDAAMLMHILGAVLFLVCVMCSLQSVVCAVFGLHYLQSLVCLMCSIQRLWLAAKAARRCDPDSC